MPLFKDTVALEACPARTAETVSYVATFSVLGWLILSNYSSLTDSERETLTLASADSLPTESPSLTTAAPSLANETAHVAAATLNESNAANITPEPTPHQSSDFVTLRPVWHTSLEQFQSLDSIAMHREFSSEQWSNSATELKIEDYAKNLAQPLPLIDNSRLFDVAIGPENAGLEALASNIASEGEPMGEVTVTGTASERLVRRAANIERPNIPRPYRAQELQRSIVRPPRIQAFKP